MIINQQPWVSQRNLTSLPVGNTTVGFTCWHTAASVTEEQSSVSHLWMLAHCSLIKHYPRYQKCARKAVVHPLLSQYSRMWTPSASHLPGHRSGPTYMNNLATLSQPLNALQFLTLIFLSLIYFATSQIVFKNQKFRTSKTARLVKTLICHTRLATWAWSQEPMWKWMGRTRFTKLSSPQNDNSCFNCD